MGRTTDKKQDPTVRLRDDRRKLMALALVVAIGAPVVMGFVAVLAAIFG